MRVMNSISVAHNKSKSEATKCRVTLLLVGLNYHLDYCLPVHLINLTTRGSTFTRTTRSRPVFLVHHRNYATHDKALMRESCPKTMQEIAMSLHRVHRHLIRVDGLAKV